MLETTPEGVIIRVRVIPRAGRSGLAGTRGDALVVRLQAPPVDGAANAELVEVIAAACGVPKRSVAIVGGHRTRDKRVQLLGADRTVVEAALSRQLKP